MAWNTELTLMLRILANDMDTPMRHADSYLGQVLVTSAILVDADIEFATNYAFNVESGTVSPDPLAGGDAVFKALVPLKAACIIQLGDFQQAVGQGIKVRDGDSMIDTSVKFRGFKDILELGPCASYDKLKWQIQATGAGVGGVGGMVLSPYRGPDIVGLNSLSWFFDDFASTLGRCRRV